MHDGRLADHGGAHGIPGGLLAVVLGERYARRGGVLAIRPVDARPAAEQLILGEEQCALFLDDVAAALDDQAGLQPVELGAALGALQQRFFRDDHLGRLVAVLDEVGLIQEGVQAVVFADGDELYNVCPGDVAAAGEEVGDDLLAQGDLFAVHGVAGNASLFCRCCALRLHGRGGVGGFHFCLCVGA